MTAVIKLPPSPKPAASQASAANDPRRSPVAAAAISDMRAALGRSAIESTWAKLTDQVKAMILYGAKLRPAALIHTPLTAMSGDEREQIRMAIVAMQNAVLAFGRQNVSRAAFADIGPSPCQIKPPMPPAITKLRPEKMEALQELMDELARDGSRHH